MAMFNQWIETDGCGTMPTSLVFIDEPLTITSLNSFPPVSQTPNGGLFQIIINGTIYTTADGSFSYSGKNITWTSAIISVNPGDDVVAVYSYQG